MARCKYCGAEIDWITSLEGKRVPVDPDPVFVIEGGGRREFLDDMGATLIGRQAAPWEARSDMDMAFVPHRRTCPALRGPVRRRVERGADSGGLAPAT